MKTATHEDLTAAARKVLAAALNKGNQAHAKEAQRLADARTLTRKDKERLSSLVSRYL